MSTGASSSLLLHPSEFIESRNEAEAMFGRQTVRYSSSGGRPRGASVARYCARVEKAASGIKPGEGEGEGEGEAAKKLWTSSRSRRHRDMRALEEQGGAAEGSCAVACAR